MLGGKTVGFIGAGVMAEAIARGLIRAGMSAEAMGAADPDERRRDLFHRELGIRTTADNESVVRSADVLVLAVKPRVVLQVVDDLVDVVTGRHLVISIAVGVKASAIEERLRANVPVIRVMPNTPCLVGEGAVAIARGKHAGAEHVEMAMQTFGAVGRVVEVTEDRMDAVTGLSGSGPAYVCMFIEALADGGVQMGLPRQTALMLAAQTVLGAAKMVVETGSHPAELRDRVATPGGTTIAGIARLERAGFRSAAIEAVASATVRSREIGRSADS